MEAHELLDRALQLVPKSLLHIVGQALLRFLEQAGQRFLDAIRCGRSHVLFESPLAQSRALEFDYRYGALDVLLERSHDDAVRLVFLRRTFHALSYHSGPILIDESQRAFPVELLPFFLHQDRFQAAVHGQVEKTLLVFLDEAAEGSRPDLEPERLRLVQKIDDMPFDLLLFLHILSRGNLQFLILELAPHHLEREAFAHHSGHVLRICAQPFPHALAPV